MKKVITFGELMLRLAPNGYYRFFQDDQLQATFGGSEANVAASLALFGLSSTFVTKLPDNAIGKAAINSLKYLGVDTEKIVLGGERMGIYFIEKGASQRSSVCVYDRKYSSFDRADENDYDWENIFKGADWFHFSGITPALGENVAKICKKACIEAKKQGLKVSCDLNYRANLWGRKEAGEALSELCRYVDVCFSGNDDATEIFGVPPTLYADGSGFDRQGFKEAAKQLKDRFGFETVAFVTRHSISANDGELLGMVFDGENYCFSKEYRMHIVDSLGAGDAFCAGIIYALLSGKDSSDVAKFGVAASALKHSVEGDFNRVSAKEVEGLAGGDDSGEIKR